MSQGRWWAGLGWVVEGLIKGAGALLANVTSLATVIMMVVGTVDVLGTKLFNAPLPATYEATETLMVALVFGGLAYAQQNKSHVRVEFLVRRFPPHVRAVLYLFGLLVGAAFFILLTWKSASYFWQSWLMKESEPSLIRFPIYPSKLVMLVGAGLMSLQLLVDLCHAARAVLGPRAEGKGSA